MTKGLAAQEIAQYQTRGYVIPSFQLPDDLLGRLRAGVDALLAGYTDVPQEDLANPHMLPPGQDDRPNPFLEAATHPGILDLVESVLGPDLVLWITRVLCKPAAVGREVPWHQDGEYWPMRPLSTCSVWIAIDPVSTDNGCMRFIPGSHQHETLYRHHVTDRSDVVLKLELDRDQFDEADVVNVELAPGQVSLHDVRLIHGSLANRSGQRRAALILRYMPATCHYDRDLVTRRSGSSFNIADQPLLLVRGTDRTNGRNDFSHGHQLWWQRYSRGLAVASGSVG